MKRSFKAGYPNHVYCKGINGNMVFYSTADCIYYLTLYSCLAKRYHIRTTAFSIMPNHTHSQQEAASKKTFITFNQELSGMFTLGYNEQHEREGGLFESPFGSVPKTGAKYIKNNLSYINNNGAEGRLSEGVLDYRWNLMAYCKSDHPFSEKIVPSKASQRLRSAMRYVLKLCREGKPIGYKVQGFLFKGLNTKERKQLVDYIIVQYNFMDYSALTKYYGSFDNALAAMNSNTGSEHDMREEWEDFSEYKAMMEVSGKAGYKMERINFKSLDKETLFKLAVKLSTVTRSRKKICRFLHLDISGQD